MSKIRLASATALFALAFSSSIAFAEFKQFDEPQYKHLALDWCKSWQKDCGQPAADAYCVSQGWESASKYTKAEDVEYPTRVIGDSKICDAAGCDSFSSIICQKAEHVEEETGGDGDYGEGGYEAITYDYPRSGKWHLDWCLSYNADCGKPAAEYYCQQKGHGHAKAFEIDENYGKTRNLKTGEKCTDQSCDGFKFITCE
jgi:hypothetical protein